MIKTQPEARQALHYACALLSSLYISISIIREASQAKPRAHTFAPQRLSHTLVTSLIATSYITEGVLEGVAVNGAGLSNAHVVYTISQTLIWILLAARPKSKFYGLGGTLVIASLFEILLLASSSPLNELRNLGLTADLSIRLFRLLLLLYLISDMFRTWFAKKDVQGHESESLLAANTDSRSQSDNTYGTDPLLGQRDLENGTIHPSDEDDSDSDSDEGARIKKRRAKRLQETGGWWAYLRDFSIFVPYIIPRKDRKVQFCIVISILCLAAVRVLQIMVPLQLGRVIDSILAGRAAYADLGLWLLLELVNGESGLGMVADLAKIPIKQYSYRQITNAAFHHVLSLSVDFHADKDSAEVMKAIEQGEALTNLLETAVIYIVPTIVDLLVSYVLLWWKFNVYASTTMIVASFAYMYIETVTAGWNINNRRRVTKTEREEARVMHQAVQGWQAVSHFNKFAFEKKRFGESVEAHLAAQRKWRELDAYITAFTDAMVPVTFFAIACIVLYDVSHGKASPGDFVFFIQYWDKLIYPLEMLSHQYRWLMSDLIDAERLLALLNTKPTITDKEGAMALTNIKGHVSFKNVHFHYDPRKPAVTDINIDAVPGQTVALVGMTGAGKSSIVKLLLRFYDVTSGGIEIDGHDIRDVTLSSLRDAIGVVPQDPFLFNASIMENLRYAREWATDEEIFEACRAAAIHDRILTFPDGYATKVGEQGVKLSGGELQRLAIARVFLKDPPILVLDEATSAVDTNTEAKIQAMLKVLTAGRTTFVIAHRLSTIVGADQILVIHDGSIAERGTHRELLESDGIYRSLWTKQIEGGLSEEKATTEER
ncbi:hypothetical protein GQ53DRAFT_747572 [Thozetella sp. PMI_491]|nr:hypothetical protein GQ53DRAFT_747572 [Thozetella sp. PMI_491]